MFEKPTEIDKARVAFPAHVDDLMPKYEDIPEEFKDLYNPYVKWQMKWFFEGLKIQDIPKAKAGIDANVAMDHLNAIQRSFQPKHEHKQAAVAYLASLWFEEPKVK